jgi:hypothetical protein
MNKSGELYNGGSRGIRDAWREKGIEPFADRGVGAV